MGDQRARRLDTETGRYAGDQHPLAAEVDAVQHLVSCRFSSEFLFHEKLLWKHAATESHRPFNSWRGAPPFARPITSISCPILSIRPFAILHRAGGDPIIGS